MYASVEIDSSRDAETPTGLRIFETLQGAAAAIETVTRPLRPLQRRSTATVCRALPAPAERPAIGATPCSWEAPRRPITAPAYQISTMIGSWSKTRTPESAG